jgi:hypothetical protein
LNVRILLDHGFQVSLTNISEQTCTQDPLTVGFEMYEDNLSEELVIEAYHDL